MNKFDFYKEFGNIDEDLIVEADFQQKNKTSAFKYVILAASLLIVILSTITLSAKNSKPIIQPSLTTPSEETTENCNLFYNETDNAVGSLIKIPGHFWQDLSAEEKHSVFGNLADKYTITATANFSKENEIIRLFDIKATVRLKNDLSVNLTITQNKIYDCYVLDKDSIKRTDVNGISVVAGIYKPENSALQTFFAELNIDNISLLAQMTSTEENEKYFSQFINNLTLNKKANLTAIIPVVPELKDEKFTLEEAYADSVFGSFIPRNIPSGFKFESARRFINQENNYLSVLWCKGLNDIGFEVGSITDYKRKNITSVEDVKNYDLSLYPIPRAESIPAELWEIVRDPVFKIEELNVEVVSKRVTEYDENGKITKKIDFSVLYNDTYVVSVRTTDIEPEELYNILIEIWQNNG